MSTRKPAWPVWFVLALLAGAALACSVEITTTHIKDAKITDAAGEKLNRPYSPQDTFYGVVDLGDMKDSSTIKAVWKAAEVDGLAPGAELDSEEHTGKRDQITFELAPPDSGWAAGTYELALYLDGDLKETLSFKVS